MDFAFQEQHRILRSSVREFCEREVRPHARDWDEAERFPMEIVPRLAELGLLGIRVPEQYGGSGMDMTAYAICVEECARIDGASRFQAMYHIIIPVAVPGIMSAEAGCIMIFMRSEISERSMRRMVREGVPLVS